MPNGITFDTLNLSACVDCTMVIANGPETADQHDAADRMVAKWGRDTIHLSLNCPEDCDGWFSMDDCEVCGDSLGGDRHPAVLMRPKCSECDEWVRVSRDDDPARRFGGSWAHLDGQPLCPVMTASGYRPADHPAAH